MARIIKFGDNMGFKSETQCWVCCDCCEAESPKMNAVLDRTVAIEDGFVELKIELVIKGSQKKSIWLCPQCYKTKFKAVRGLFPEIEPESKDSLYKPFVVTPRTVPPYVWPPKDSVTGTVINTQPYVLPNPLAPITPVTDITATWTTNKSDFDFSDLKATFIRGK